MSNGNSNINEIKARINPLDIVSKYVTLTKSGTRYKGLCPFHQEKTPSFTLDVENGLYYCFGCQAGGDVIKFLMDIEGWNFIETMRYLSKETGVSFSQGDSKTRTEKERLFNVNQRVANYYMKNLGSSYGESAREYLKNRGFSDDIIKLASLGYAFPKWDSLANYSKNSDIDYSDLEKLGLINRSTNNTSVIRYYDRFRNRIIFPIRDVLGRVIGFGARTIGDDEPKYLNSPETMLYHKGNSLYGLYESRTAIKDNDYIILLEGYLDVLALWQAGYGNAIASLGTAFTEEQANIIKRYTSNIIICYDGDSAGVNAALKAINTMKNFDLNIKVVSIPNSLDPDDYIKEYGKDKFNILLEESLNGMDFMIHQLSLGFNLNNRDDKLNFAIKLVKILSKIENRIEQAGYLDAYAEQYTLDKNALEIELNKLTNSEFSTSHNVRNIRVGNSGSNLRELIALQERKLLKLLMDSKKTVPDNIFAIREHRKICEIMNSHNWSSPSELMDFLKEHNLESDFAKIMFCDAIDEDEVELVRQLSILSKERQLKSLRKKISEAVSIGEDPTDLLMKFREVEQERAQLYTNKDLSS